LGKSKDDISILMTYVALDRYRKPRGRLGFVITESVFKTVGGGQGFRRFILPGEVPVRVLSVDDLSELQPFAGASNRTSIVIIEKGLPHRYPVGYNYRRKKPGRENAIEPDMLLEDVKNRILISQFIAEPVASDDPTSAWLTGGGRSVRAIRKVLGPSDYEAHAGVYSGGANGVYWVEIVGHRPDGLILVRNLTEGAKRKVDEVTVSIEPDLLYPHLHSRDVARWQFTPSAHMVVTHLPGQRLKAISEEDMIAYYPKTYSYLKQFEKELRQRRAFKRYFTRKDRDGNIIETGPFYSIFNIGDYTFAPYKVVWPNIASTVEAAVIDREYDGKVILPQHIITLVACKTDSEAHYICSLMNSSRY